MIKVGVLAACLSALVAVAACPSPPSEGDGDGEGEGEGEIDNPYGFSMRVPQDRSVPCPGCSTPGDQIVSDNDVVCSFDLDGHDAVVYVRATPTSFASAFFPLPVFGRVQGFMSEGGIVTALDDATYDFGGNHHDDQFAFTIAGVRYTYGHSSYGFGFRSCQIQDCVKREEGANFVDGCLPQRTVPVACISVADPLPPLVDSFERCAGDPEGEEQ